MRPRCDSMVRQPGLGLGLGLGAQSATATPTSTDGEHGEEPGGQGGARRLASLLSALSLSLSLSLSLCARNNSSTPQATADKEPSAVSFCSRARPVTLPRAKRGLSSGLNKPIHSHRWAPRPPAGHPGAGPGRHRPMRPSPASPCLSACPSGSYCTARHCR